MGCSSSPPVYKYNVSYCSLVPISNKPNIFKINLIKEENIEKKPGEKFLNQCGEKKEEVIIQFLDRKEFKTNTIFYYFLEKKPIIKNLNQSLNVQPYNSNKLFKIILLSTEGASPIPNQIIEKKTKNLSYSKFIGEEIDLDDMKKRLDEVNDPNISEDDIYLNNENNKDENDKNKENNHEIIISDILNKEKFESIKKKFVQSNDKNGNCSIKSVKLFSLQIEEISTFIKLMAFLEEKKIKKFSFNENNITADFEGWDSIYEFFDKNYSIRVIDLQNSNIDDNHLYNIIRAISDKRIKILNLSKNFITLDGALIISEFLKNNKTLQILNLNQNSKDKLNSLGVKNILESLSNNPNIKIIDFSYMNLTGCGEYIGIFISNCKSIDKIILRNANLNNTDFKNIFESIKVNNIIKEIDISKNDMGGDKSLEYIAECLKENKSLNSIKMDKININNDNYNIIFDAIEKNKNINSYSINYNSKINPKIVLDFFSKQKQVKTLYYHPYDKNDKDDKKKELSLEDKKAFDKLKIERPDMKIIH